MSGDRRSEWSAGLLLRSSKSALLAQPFTIYAAPRGGRLLRDDQLYSTALSPGGYEQIGFARSLADARRGVRRIHRQRRHHAFLRGVSAGVHRRVSLEPCGDLDRLLGLAARR